MRILRLAGLVVLFAVTVFVFSLGSSNADAQGQAGAPKGPTTSWTTYGSNLASHRYSPADQINKDNFSKLEIAWPFKTENLGPRPEFQFQATPLMVNGTL